MHGINPSHGWTLAVLYSIRNKNKIKSGIISSSILAAAHFFSSIVVVLAYILFSIYVEVPQTYLNYAAAVALAILAYIFWKEKPGDLEESQHGHLYEFTGRMEHEYQHWHKSTGYHTHIPIHQQRIMPKITALAGSALVLGFAHEEEFVILSLAVGGIDPIILMIAYALSVTVALISITLLSVTIYKSIQDKVIHYTKYLPKISAVILGILALSFGLGLF